ncbi:hypothetical protein GGG16DRAFT_65426 [Schizophyllum commune]
MLTKQRAAVAEAASPRLPLELLLHIVDCTPDQQSHLTFSLVCRALLDQSRHWAFRRLRIQRLIALRKLNALTQSSLCTFSQHVRWVSISQRQISEIGGLPFDCLCFMPNLVTLRVECMTSFQCDSFLIGPLERLSSLTTLTLDRVGFGTFSTFLYALEALPELRNLTLLDVFIRDENIPFAVHSSTKGLAKLRFLRCLLWGVMYRFLLAVMLVLPRCPPITHLDLCLPFTEDGMAGLLCDFIGVLTPTLSAMRVDPGYKHFSPTEYAKLDFSRFAALRSFTVEPVLLADWHIPGVMERILDLILFALRAPALRKLVVVLRIDGRFCHKNLTTRMEWATLNDHVGDSPCLAELKFVICGSSAGAETRGVVERLQELLPRAEEKGILQFKASANVAEWSALESLSST